MSGKFWQFIALLLASMVTACGGTNFNDTAKFEPEQSQGLAAWIDRDVDFHLDYAFVADPPRCVAVVPLITDLPPELSGYFRESLARHLYAKVDKVKLIEQGSPATEDWRWLAAASGCPYWVSMDVGKTDKLFALVWSGHRVDLSISMRRLSDDSLVWQARHSATRSVGGPATSPIGVVLGTVKSAGFLSDDDVAISLIDDAMRRVMETLPDVRQSAKLVHNQFDHMWGWKERT